MNMKEPLVQLFYAAEETRHGPSHGGAVRDHVEVTKLNHGSFHGNLYKKKKTAGEAQSVLNSALTEET